MDEEVPAEEQPRAPLDALESRPQTAAEDVPQADITTEALLERAKRMFLDESASTKASGLGRVADTATLKLICLADQACSTLWTASEARVRQCCQPRVQDGLVDKQELLGFFLADMLRPLGYLLPSEDAHPVGQRGVNGLVKAKRELKGKTKEALWRHAVSSNPAPAIAKVLASPYDVKLPAATAGVKRPASFWLDRDKAAAAARKKAADARSQAASLAADAASSRVDAARDACVAALNRNATRATEVHLECAFAAAVADLGDAADAAIAAANERVEAQEAVCMVARQREEAAERRLEEAEAEVAEAEAEAARQAEAPLWEWDDQFSEGEIRKEVSAPTSPALLALPAACRAHRLPCTPRTPPAFHAPLASRTGARTNDPCRWDNGSRLHALQRVCIQGALCRSRGLH